jgi:ectoine hydroxylase-related dioxygenase (phytanoyl-CoA dioxygenase family)
MQAIEATNGVLLPPKHKASDNQDWLRGKLARDGYAVLDERLDDDLLGRLCAETRANLAPSPFDFVVNDAPFYGERMLRGVSLASKCPSYLELLALPVIDRVMRASLLEHCRHVLLSTSTALEISNQGVAKPQPFHRDETVWADYLPRMDGGPEYAINIMIAGTEFTQANGATRLIPGSNHWDKQRLPTADDAIAYLEMPRGGLGVWVGSLYHGAGVNQTPNPRLGIILSFCLGWLRTIDNQWEAFNEGNVRHLPKSVQTLLGFDAHGMSMGIYDGVSPMARWAAEDARRGAWASPRFTRE